MKKKLGIISYLVLSMLFVAVMISSIRVFASEEMREDENTGNSAIFASNTDAMPDTMAISTEQTSIEVYTEEATTRDRSRDRINLDPDAPPLDISNSEPEVATEATTWRDRSQDKINDSPNTHTTATTTESTTEATTKHTTETTTKHTTEATTGKINSTTEESSDQDEAIASSTEIATASDADAISDSDDKEKKDGFFQKYWWLVLIIILLLGVIAFLIVYLMKWKKQIIVEDKNEDSSLPSNKEISQGDIIEETTIKRKGIPITILVMTGGEVIAAIDEYIDGSLIVGRDKICDVKLDDPRLSKQHFALGVEGTTINIMDLDSLNGTFVNGVKIKEKRKLEKKDKILCGSLEIEIRW